MVASAASQMRIQIHADIAGTKEVNRQLKIMSDKAQKMRNAFTVGSRDNGMVQWAKKGQDAMVGFNGAALSTLFLGMQLQKTFTGALTAIFEGFKKAIPEAHQFNLMTNKLSANWEFFKFQLADALAQSPLFQKFVAGLINILKVLQRMSPEAKALTVSIIALTAAFGAFLFASATIKLGLAGLIDGSKTLQGLATGFSWGKMASTLWTVGVIAAITLTVKALDEFYDSSELGKQAGENMKSVWKDTMDSVLEPLMQIFKDLGTDIRNSTETLIALGVVMHNFILIVGMVIDTFIFFGKIIKNIIDLFIDLQSVIWKVASAALSFLRGDYAAAVKSASSITKDFATDIEDIGNAWDKYVSNIDNKALSLEGITPALEAYRAQLDGQISSQISSGTSSSTEAAVNNIIIVQNMEEARGTGLIKDNVFTELQGVDPTLIN